MLHLSICMSHEDNREVILLMPSCFSWNCFRTSASNSCIRWHVEPTCSLIHRMSAYLGILVFGLETVFWCYLANCGLLTKWQTFSLHEAPKPPITGFERDSHRGMGFFTQWLAHSAIILHDAPRFLPLKSIIQSSKTSFMSSYRAFHPSPFNRFLFVDCPVFFGQAASPSVYTILWHVLSIHQTPLQLPPCFFDWRILLLLTWNPSQKTCASL